MANKRKYPPGTVTIMSVRVTRDVKAYVQALANQTGLAQGEVLANALQLLAERDAQQLRA